MALHVSIAVVDGFTDSGLAIALDVLRAANVLARRPLFRWSVTSARGGTVRSAGGLTVETRSHRRTDQVLVPGMWADGPEALRSFLERADVRRLTERLSHTQGNIGASCGGTFLLAGSGLLDGRTATTTWWLAAEFRRRFPLVKLDVDRALVVDRRLMTAGAVFAMGDLALAVVAREGGRELSRSCARALLLEPHASQSAHMVMRQLVAEPPLVRAAETWVRRRLAQPISIGALAKGLAMSQRTLTRQLHQSLGLSPMQLVQRLRVEEATRLLEGSDASVEAIADKVGYANPGTLRRLLRRASGKSPAELRRAGRTLHAR